MINTPQLNQAFPEILIAAGIGTAAAMTFDMNPGLVATVCAVSTFVNYALFGAANLWVRPALNNLTKSQFEISEKLTYTFTVLAVSTVTFIAAQQLDILSSKLAGVLIFCSCACFLGRLRIIYTTPPAPLKAKTE